MLIIDSREKSLLTDLVIKKCDKMSIPNKKQWIEVGDYVIGDVCFEAKSTHDFLSSVITKRMWTQIDNMDRCYKTNIVVVYGSLSDALSYTKYSGQYTNMAIGPKKQLLTNKFYGGLGRITMDSDVKPFWVPTEQAAANLICTMAKMQPMNRPEIKPHLHKRMTTDDIRINMLSLIKGISDKKAKLLLKEFGCLMEIGDTPKKNICQLDGFGDTTATKIQEVFNSDKKVKQ